MTVEYLQDPNDPRVSDYTSLTDTRLRQIREPAEGLYIAESSTVLRRAIRAGHRPRSFFLAPKWLNDLADVLAEFPDIPAFVGDDATLEAITGFHLHRGALAAMHRPEPLVLDEVLANARRVIVLENIVDHTNVGAVFRSAAALGADAVLISPRCADPLYRRAVRVSMGTVFQVPWVRLESWPEQMGALSGHGFVTAALALNDAAVDISTLRERNVERLALVLGTEGQGLDPATIAAADLSIRIPMQNGVDSLNVATAGALALWECKLK